MFVNADDGEGPVAAAAPATPAEPEAELARHLRYVNDLVGVVSHDFRTPLTAIRGLSELIGEEDFSAEEVKELAARITRSAQRLNRMISDLVEFHQFGQGQLRLELGQVDLNAVIEQALDQCRADAPRHSFAFQPDAALAGLPGDRARLLQATVALLGHALEQSPSGGTVGMRTHRAGELARLEVQVSGHGVRVDAVARVLEQFSGGFALALARRIVRLHGGDLWAEGAPDAPGTLCVSLPLSGGGARI
jgi:signal transduction histidine kinase